MDIKRYWFEKLLAPKVVTIDSPGIIHTKVDRKYGKSKSKKRLVWYFEDTIADLQIDTAKKLGKEETKSLWYKIGKKVTLRYMLLSRAKRPPFFLRTTILKYVLMKGKLGGVSVSEKILYNKKNNVLILEGKDNVICRKSDVHEYFAGCMSMLLSFLVGENIEARVDCKSCPKKCKIIAHPKIEQKFIPSSEELKISEKYYRLNFERLKNLTDKTNSFSDLIKFKQIFIDKKGKFCFREKTILPIEIGGINLIYEEYKKENEEKIFKEGIISSSERIAKEILGDKNSQKEKVSLMVSILSSLGWGVPYFKKQEGKVQIILKNSPFSKYPPMYQSCLINGCLNYIFNKKFDLNKIETKTDPYTIILEYKEN